MSVYRITSFSAPDMSKAVEATESMRNTLESVNADFIDIVSHGDGTGVVVAKYHDQAAMDAASETAKQVFGQLVAQGIIDGDSIQPKTGDVLMSV